MSIFLTGARCKWVAWVSVLVWCLSPRMPRGCCAHSPPSNLPLGACGACTFQSDRFNLVWTLTFNFFSHQNKRIITIYVKVYMAGRGGRFLGLTHTYTQKLLSHIGSVILSLPNLAQWWRSSYMCKHKATMTSHDSTKFNWLVWVK